MSFHFTHNPYSTLTQSSISPFCCSFLHGFLLFPLCLPSIPSFPHTSVTWYPWWKFSLRPKAKRFSLWAQGPASTTWPRELGCATGAVAPHVQEVTLSDTDVSCWYICVFSSNITNLSSSSSSGRLFFTKFTHVFLQFSHLLCGMQFKSHLNTAPVFHEKVGF